jgi:sugar lactone lactonase YvrE
MRRSLKFIVPTVAGLVAALLAGFLFLGPPLTAPGIDYSVYADGLEKVAGLTVGSDGTLYATLEKSAGRGQLVSVDREGIRVLLSGLNKPDGVVRVGETLFVTNEIGDVGLVAFTAAATRRYTGIVQAEGIDVSADGSLLVIEDRKRDGRLLRVQPDDGEIDVLQTGLSGAEGVCEAPDGSVYFVEKHAPYLSRLNADGLRRIGEGFANPGFLQCLNDGSLLITEDRTNLGRLLRYSDNGIEVLARNLRAPQAVVVGADGALYLAEQTRNRVLRLDGI